MSSRFSESFNSGYTSFVEVGQDDDKVFSCRGFWSPKIRTALAKCLGVFAMRVLDIIEMTNDFEITENHTIMSLSEFTANTFSFVDRELILLMMVLFSKTNVNVVIVCCYRARDFVKVCLTTPRTTCQNEIDGTEQHTTGNELYSSTKPRIRRKSLVEQAMPHRANKQRTRHKSDSMHKPDHRTCQLHQKSHHVHSFHHTYTEPITAAFYVYHTSKPRFFHDITGLIFYR